MLTRSKSRKSNLLLSTPTIPLTSTTTTTTTTTTTKSNKRTRVIDTVDIKTIVSGSSLLVNLTKVILSKCMSFLDGVDLVKLAVTCKTCFVTAQLPTSIPHFSLLTLCKGVKTQANNWKRWNATTNDKQTSRVLIHDKFPKDHPVNVPSWYSKRTKTRLKNTMERLKRVEKLAIFIETVFNSTRLGFYLYAVSSSPSFKTSLLSLTLKNCILQAEDIRLISEFKKLQILNLTNCNEAGLGTENKLLAFPKSIEKLTVLNSFNNNGGWLKLLGNFSDADHHVNRDIGEQDEKSHPQLRELVVLHSIFAKSDYFCLHKLANLEALHLYGHFNWDIDVGLYTPVSLLKGLGIKSLHIDLHSNNFQYYEDFYQVLGTLPNLQRLQIFTDGESGLVGFAPELSTLEKLSDLIITSPSGSTYALTDTLSDDEESDIDVDSDEGQVHTNYLSSILENYPTTSALTCDIQDIPTFVARQRSEEVKLFKKCKIITVPLDCRARSLLIGFQKSKTLKILKVSTPRIETLFPMLTHMHTIETLLIVRARLDNDKSDGREYIKEFAKMRSLRTLEWHEPIEIGTFKSLLELLPELTALSIRVKYRSNVPDNKDQECQDIIKCILQHKSLKFLSVVTVCKSKIELFTADQRKQIYSFAGIKFGTRGFVWSSGLDSTFSL